MLDIAPEGGKTLLEIGGRSMLCRTIDELRAAGLGAICIVVGPDSAEIRAHLAAEMAHGDICFAEQSEATGLVDAVRIGRAALGAQDVIVALPDVLLVGHPCPTAELIGADATTLLLTKVEAPWGEMLRDTGRVHALDGDNIRAIAAKQKGEPFPLGAHRIMGRYLWDAAFFAEVERLDASDGWTGPERDDVQVVQALALRGDLRGIVVKTEYIDVGIPEGYAYAQSRFS